MNASEQVPGVSVPDDGWEDSLLPQQVLPVASSSAALDAFCDATEVVAAASSAVDACGDAEASCELLQPLAEAYLLAVRNEARRLPKIVSASVKGRAAPSKDSMETIFPCSEGMDRLLHDPFKLQEKASSPVPHVSDTRVSQRTASQLNYDAAGANGIPSCQQPPTESNRTEACSSYSSQGEGVKDTDEASAVVYQLADKQTCSSEIPRGPTEQSDECSPLPLEYRASSCKIASRYTPSEGACTPDCPTSDADSEDVDAGDKSYVHRLLVLDKRRRAARLSGTAPSSEWLKKSLSEFRKLRDCLSHEQATLVQAASSPHTIDRYRNWNEREWRLYCRCYPPSSEVLAACDSVTLCRLLFLLAEDISLQHRTVIRHQGQTPTSKTDPDATLPQPEAGRSQEVPCSCCRLSCCHVTLQQASWLFGVFLFLDELQAMDADVAFCIQSLRRECESARRKLVRHSKSHMGVVPNAEANRPTTKGEITAEATQETAATGQSERHLLAALDILILIIGEFFNQK
ncbi:hypothetical protein TGDOM2_203120 [Toxoplasma gondii GAB2-2007-GAL-DOM2]|uniref:Uncharacterized protein n=8 Tax=Toxoplasma gondii TaxID=5811 RepID=A0A125YQX1_TOXGV|nr:hypothetical protein TGGT1_203120 [Toxoplasma gondii GT1]ESS32920.1 hypothetical protein TGVEG_203120 [Toxoplasma gondii VEG]KAF4642861.1 hypothetical protein TGRH88_035900 [Toxoplasma gondii]KFG37730.1 hypothetical protein TGDOM2_203120 [Toxoplasma gondii GAB2-2007-GAL-DOM2]KFG46003.1 hypothetical protein TGP89_203120 [Toxoplasma gondii p89]KFG53701.1 hypothetical protein TGFOU_203120 [Toxoplasma gondii FOU]RQX73261.1 hypothetical protein TGCAST_203120 [Toxoplasma gondii CAST]